MKPPKPRYHTTNWPEYNRSLQARGDLTIWFSPELAWHANERAGQTGRPTRYSDQAIQIMLPLKVLFQQGLRQMRGLVSSLVRMLGLDWKVPCYSTVSRRQATLTVQIPVRRSREPLHLLVDSTGIKIHGEGEWKVKRHGPEYRRGWRKVYLAISRDTQEIHAVEMTDQRQADGSQVEALLSQLPTETVLGSLGGDGAYDSRRVYRVVHGYGAELIVPPRKNGKPWQDKAAWAVGRNDKLAAIGRVGRSIWKRWSGYHRRSLVETAMHRFKRLGDRLLARKPERQVAEVHVRCVILNRFAHFGMPKTVAHA
ncbi:IS5 family transposase [Vogesella sp. DC21W]|uniref:IS5 family transposase n=1 Tax=Vogesella aquatica TaxID=2984206 RepID=A0ABT5IU99_9NEIS|nr:IS5 family transposase [Vogesella aquatica]MDC7716141.1 IS5 family transposase [Vogesella aquatica]